MRKETENGNFDRLCFVQTYIYCFVQTYIYCFVQTYIYCFVQTYIYCFVQTYIYCFVQTYIYCFVQTYIYCFVQSYIPSYASHWSCQRGVEYKPANSVGLKCARLMSGRVHCDTRQRHYRLATSEKPGETGRTFHSVYRELLVGLGVAKMGVNIPCVEKFDPSSEPSVVDAK